MRRSLLSLLLFCFRWTWSRNRSKGISSCLHFWTKHWITSRSLSATFPWWPAIEFANQHSTSNTRQQSKRASSTMSSSKPILLHCGDDIRWNKSLYQTLQSKFTIVRSYSASRSEFITALKNGTYGNFVAIYRPFWGTGGEMSPWNSELIDLLPSSCKIYASAGAGFDWVDTQALAKKGVIYCNAGAACTESVADTAIWLILSTFRDFGFSSAAAKTCDPEKFKEAQRRAALMRNPRGHTLGIIGLGKIGFGIAKKAYESFGMRIVYVSYSCTKPDGNLTNAFGIERHPPTTLQHRIRNQREVLPRSRLHARHLRLCPRSNTFRRRSSPQRLKIVKNEERISTHQHRTREIDRRESFGRSLEERTSGCSRSRRAFQRTEHQSRTRSYG